MSSERPEPPLVSFTAVNKRFPANTKRAMAAGALPYGRAAMKGTVALADVTFELGPGEILGIIGRNGAGKSTILKLAAGIHEPTSGSVRVAGIPAPMIELGLSLHPDLTGWENLPLAATLFGVDPSEVDGLTDQIVAFSGIEEHLDLPVKHFSTGMVARLGFAIATHVGARVLLIDEVLAVGDPTFQERCIERVRAIAAGGSAVLFVSHGLDLVAQVCERVIQIDRGRLVDDGAAVDVIARYVRGVHSLRPAATQHGMILNASLADDSISSGQVLHVGCVVDVADASVPLQLQTECTTPSQPDRASRNLDELPVGSLTSAGTWALEADIGPMVTTAGRLELLMSLVTSPEGGDKELVDKVRLPFEVRGDDVGPVRVAMRGTWDNIGEADLTIDKAPHGAADRSAAIWADDVTKVFHQGRRRAAALPWVPRPAPLVALEDITFSIHPGDSVGLIGPNGAGKSTLLRALVGVTKLSSGRCGTDGRVASILELGAGFHGDMTGAENLAFTWKLYGGRPADWPQPLEAIADFAAIGPVLGDPVKHYSTGMSARLAIALALELDPDVLVMDEALTVGDLDFRERATRRLRAMVAGGTTLLFATHDLHLLANLCSRVLRLDDGRLVDDGDTASVIAAAGGAGWAGSMSGADGSMLLRGLVVAPERLEWNEPFSVEVEVDVIRPRSDCYLQFSIRNSLSPEERRRDRTQDEVLAETACLQRVPDSAALLGSVGRRLLRGRLEGVPLSNRFDVVVSAIDEVNATVVSEQWRTVIFGSRAGTGSVQHSSSLFDVRWSAEQLTARN